jgi:hypothetical protein
VRKQAGRSSKAAPKQGREQQSGEALPYGIAQAVSAGAATKHREAATVDGDTVAAPDLAAKLPLLHDCASCSNCADPPEEREQRQRAGRDIGRKGKK